MWTFTVIILTQAFFPQCFGVSDFIPLIYANSRLIWSLAMSWVIIACNYGYGGVINDFLSAKIWIPIEKIGLSLYIIHPQILISYIQRRRSPVDFNFDTIVS